MIKPYALLIDAEHESANALASSLEERGFQTQRVTTGHEAQARLSFTNPDLILLAVDLPTLPAAVILRQIHGQPRLAHARVFLLADDPEAAAPLAAHAEGVLLRHSARADLYAHLWIDA